MKPMTIVSAVFLVGVVVALGAEAFSPTGISCTVDSDCNTGPHAGHCWAWCKNGVCSATVFLNGACSSPGTASSPTYCQCGDISYCSAGSVCLLQQSDATACQYNYQCMSGTCTNGLCEQPSGGGTGSGGGGGGGGGGDTSSSDSWWGKTNSIILWCGLAVAIVIIAGACCWCCRKRAHNAALAQAYVLPHPQQYGGLAYEPSAAAAAGLDSGFQQQPHSAVVYTPPIEAPPLGAPAYAPPMYTMAPEQHDRVVIVNHGGKQPHIMYGGAMAN